jgi:hypothetical protein
MLGHGMNGRNEGIYGGSLGFVSIPKVALLGCVLFLLAPLRASAQDLTIRVIDARSGKPLRRVDVAVVSWNGPPTSPKDKLAMDGTTDSEGRVLFRLPQPLRAHIGFEVGDPWDLAGCWHVRGASPEAVLRYGLVADYNESKCGKSKVKVSARPGEVIIVERKLTTWEKMRRELP